MPASQSRLLVNSVILCNFAEGKTMLFGAEIFNSLSVAIVVLEPSWKQRVHTTYSHIK